MPDRPEADRRILILAAAIVEWSGVLEHLDALEQMGQTDLRRRPSVRMQVQRELDRLIEQWPRFTSPVLTDDQVIWEAREYATKHQDTLDELIGDDESD